MSDPKTLSQLRQQYHCNALNAMLDGVEALADAEAVAAVYVARAGLMLAALRNNKMIDEPEIRQLAAKLLELALSDKSVIVPLDPAGNEMSASERTH